MIEQTAIALTARAFFKSGKTGKTGLTVTVDVYDHAGTKVVNAGAASEIGGGFYQYTLAANLNTGAGQYTFLFKTADTTVNQQQLGVDYTIGEAWVQDLDAAISTRAAAATALSTAQWTNARAALQDHLDADVSSRLATAGYTAPDNADIATILADVVTLLARLTATRAGLLDHLDADISTRAAAATALSTAQWTNARAALVDHLDADVSSRLATSGYTAPDNADIATILTDVNTLLARLTAQRATNLDDLDATISSRLASVDYTAPDNADIATILTDVALVLTRLTDARATRLDHLDADVSSRLATGGYTAPDNADIVATLAGVATLLVRLTAQRATNLDNLDASVSDTLTTDHFDATYVAPGNEDLTTLLARISDSRATLLDNLADLDATISSRLASVDYTAPDNDGIGTLLVRLSDARALLLDNLADLTALTTLNENITLILAMPDIAAFLSQRPDRTVRDDIEGYVLGDSIRLTRSLVPVPAGQTILSCTLTVKQRLSDSDEDALLQITVDPVGSDGGQVTDDGASGTGEVVYTLTPEDSRAIGISKPYYDIQAFTSSNEPHTFYDGRFVLRQDVTISVP